MERELERKPFLLIVFSRRPQNRLAKERKETDFDRWDKKTKKQLMKMSCSSDFQVEITMVLENSIKIDPTGFLKDRSRFGKLLRICVTSHLVQILKILFKAH